MQIRKVLPLGFFWSIQTAAQATKCNAAQVGKSKGICLLGRLKFN
jgi:hypothetical protein